MLRLLAVLVVVVVAGAGTVWAGAVGETERLAFERVISGQIEAFRADDGARAYGYAAPLIKRIFPTPDRFMAMVRRSYQPVYRPRAFRFGRTETDAAGRPIQRVELVGPDGFGYEAIYTMERQPDGSWQIAGCALVRLPGLET